MWIILRKKNCVNFILFFYYTQNDVNAELAEKNLIYDIFYSSTSTEVMTILSIFLSFGLIILQYEVRQLNFSSSRHKGGFF